jgi:hypothetical protein
MSGTITAVILHILDHDDKGVVEGVRRQTIQVLTERLDSEGSLENFPAHCRTVAATVARRWVEAHHREPPQGQP